MVNFLQLKVHNIYCRPGLTRFIFLLLFHTGDKKKKKKYELQKVQPKGTDLIVYL
jgi:hypothetical protein